MHNPLWTIHGVLASNCCQDMKELIQDEDACRRQTILKAFGYQCKETHPKHNCCDNCVKVCQCLECPPYVGLHVPEDDLSASSLSSVGRTRPVVDNQKTALKEHLIVLRNSLIEKQSNELLNTVSLPSSLVEFGSVQIRQVLDNCHRIFSVEDVENHVEVWRKQHAHGILQAINDVFGDIVVMEEDDDTMMIIDDTCYTELEQGQDGSVQMSIVDSQELEEMESQEQVDDESAQNTSSFIRNLASTFVRTF